MAKGMISKSLVQTFRYNRSPFKWRSLTAHTPTWLKSTHLSATRISGAVSCICNTDSRSRPACLSGLPWPLSKWHFKICRCWGSLLVLWSYMSFHKHVLPYLNILFHTEQCPRPRKSHVYRLSYPLPHHTAITNLFLSPQFGLFLECHVYGITQYVTFFR